VLFVGGTVLSQLALLTVGVGQSGWKFGLAYPVTVGALVLIDSRRHLRTFLLLASLAVLNLLLDYRIFGALCLVAGAATLLEGARFSIGARIVAGGAVLAAALGFGLVYRSAIGLTGTRMDLQQRRAGSNAARVAGLVVAYHAIRESPVLGHGSWARSDEALDAWAILQEQLGGEKASDVQARALLSPEGSTIRAHSAILQAWVEAGLAGLGFFLLSFVAAALMLVRMLRRKRISR